MGRRRGKPSEAQQDLLPRYRSGSWYVCHLRFDVQLGENAVAISGPAAGADWRHADSLITGIPFGFMALIGLLSLSGMLIRNGIVLVEEIEQQKSA